MRSGLLFPFLAGLLALPASATAQAEPFPDLGIVNPTAAANVTLYLHVNGFQEFPINTQPPVDWFVPGRGVGLTTASTTCSGVAPNGKEHHTWRGFASPGYVEYNYTPNGQPQVHGERGLSYDVELDGDTITLVWYLQTQAGVPGAVVADPNNVPVAIPNVVVRGTVRTREAVSTNESAYDAGTLVAQGQSEPALLARDATQGARWIQVGDTNVYEFKVPMQIAQRTIPKDEGYNLRVDAFVDNPECGEPDSTGYLMPNLVRVHTSPELRPRMLVRALEAIRIEYLHPQFLLDRLVVHASANSPWGNYDVDEREGGITLEIVDKGGKPAAPSLERRDIVQRTHEHNHHTEAVDVSYVWPFKDDKAAPGEYFVRLRVANDQGTAVAYATSRIELGDSLTVTRCGSLDGNATGCETELQNPDGSPRAPEPPASPAWPLLGMLFCLLGAAASRRR